MKRRWRSCSRYFFFMAVSSIFSFSIQTFAQLFQSKLPPPVPEDVILGEDADDFRRKCFAMYDSVCFGLYSPTHYQF